MTVVEQPAPPATALIGLFPDGSHLDEQGELVVGGCRVTDLADRFGTPAVVVDENALRRRARRYVSAMTEHWPNSQVVFASKSFPCTAIVRTLVEEGLGVDVAGGGELVTALAAGVDPARLVVHGNAKTTDELAMAVDAGAGTIVVDNFDDIDRLERVVGDRRQRVLLRVIPEVSADTHEAMVTGQRGSKFGLSVPDAVRAAERLAASDRLLLEGLHVHVGSQLLDTEPFRKAVEALAAIGELGEHAVYDLGGGLGVRYTYDDRPPTVEEYVRTLTDAARKHLPSTARLIIEPGRSLVAEAAMTLYRVVTVKPGPRTLVAVDGGMADNLEPMLYGQRFEATVASRVGGGERCDLVGRHCESGDTLIRDLPLREPRVDDVVAVPVTGAYCSSLANNYNGARRPPVVFCRDGEAREVVRRETYDDLLRRDVDGGTGTGGVGIG
ncbi:diaminopimelate decarboxylase [Streptomyces sp. Je 1-79]|uniref:diaminopimelate decarboxylase n=1 Tax=Streptomyces sp. Je 1-79 TaxID=2943847 RepID=UPI0021A29387|nr:diaminopimelate decarboxylase [Streptomyces sp. Je 1-79]MCT4357849.1 diaminopimelate decarboxylase [Streptomyces sp. Je 1-79]